MHNASRDDWQITAIPRQHVLLTGNELPTVRHSPVEFRQIGHGFVPQAMEEKWFIYAQENHVYFHRSWTGYCIYVADFEPVEGGFRLARLAINRDPGQYSETNDQYDCSYLHVPARCAPPRARGRVPDAPG